MTVYLDGVFILNFLVDLFLILGTNRLTGYPPGIKAAFGAAFLGGIYGGACLLPEFRFLGSIPWRVVFLGLISVIAFGFNRSAVHRGAIFVLLTMALGGLASGAGIMDFGAVSICALLLWLLCRVGFPGGTQQRRLIPVELNWQGRSVKLLALQDTGNELRDPLTGERVLVCGADVGESLLNLPKECFADPSKILLDAALPGLRLVPYHSVGQPGGMLLALRLKGSVINGKSADPLVAFAPEEIGKGKEYRMLAGGIV